MVWIQTSDGATAGPSSGGGGGGYSYSGVSGNGASASAGYGGGGGGGGGGRLWGTSAPGRSGIVVITYTPVPPTTAPDVPTSLAATAGTSQISLTWTAPTSDGGSAITNYKIYRDTSSPATSLLATIGNITSYTDNNVVTGTTYYYRVKAVNALGDSAYSNEDSAVATPACPTGPNGGNVTGWAWSDTIGWISLNASDSGTCTSVSYGLNIASDGAISGYAWSENVGWISANASDLSGCPTSPCTARMNGSSMEGWMKVLGANQAEAGGWDGFISLSGSNYGPTLASDGTFSGYAWGDMNLGWISFNTSFSAASTTWVACTPNYVCTDETHRDNLCTVPVENEACSAGLICSTGTCVIPPAPTPADVNGALKVSPRLIRPGGATRVSWNISYADSCTVIEDNPQINDPWTGSTGSTGLYISSAITQQTTYTLSCTGAGGSLQQAATVYLAPVWQEI